VDKIQLEIVDRPSPTTPLSIPVTPEGLQEAVLLTADTLKAVRFTVSDDTFRSIHNKLYNLCKNKHLKLKYTKLRAKHRTHRVKDDPYDVIMWADHIPASDSQENTYVTRAEADAYFSEKKWPTSSSSETPKDDTSITSGPTDSEDDDM
jgi:hypothetical protein